MNKSMPGSNNRKLKAGVIGLGVGMRHLSAYDRSEYAEPYIACDLDPEKLVAANLIYPDIETTSDPRDVILNPEIDVVSIASYDADHYEQIMLAIENKKHIFVEKPVCVSSSQLNAIENALEKNPDICFSSNLILRKAERFIELRKKITAGDLGQIYYVEGDYDYGRLKKLTNGWRAEQYGYSVFLGGGIHMVDLLCWLHGSHITQVSAIGSKICSSSSEFDGFDTVLASMQYNDGSIGKISANFGSVTKHHHRLAIYGTLGTFHQSHEGSTYHFGRDDAPNEIKDLCAYPANDKGDSLIAFIESIVLGKSPDVKKNEVLRAMRIALAIDEALMTGKTIRVKDDENSIW